MIFTKGACPSDPACHPESANLSFCTAECERLKRDELVKEAQAAKATAATTGTTATVTSTVKRWDESSSSDSDVDSASDSDSDNDSNSSDSTSQRSPLGGTSVENANTKGE